MNTMPNATPQPGPPHQRKIHYIDHVLQKRLLIALVILEVIVVSIAGAILYIRLNTIVDESLYRIHFAGQPSIFTVLLKESLLILGGLVAANLAALFIADRIWSHYVRSILLALCGLLSSTRDLDLRADADIPQRHKVLVLALAWRRTERARHLALREALTVMESVATRPSASDEEFRSCLLAVRRQLPEADRHN